MARSQGHESETRSAHVFQSGMAAPAVASGACSAALDAGHRGADISARYLVLADAPMSVRQRTWAVVLAAGEGRRLPSLTMDATGRAERAHADEPGSRHSCSAKRRISTADRRQQRELWPRAGATTYSALDCVSPPHCAPLGHRRRRRFVMLAGIGYRPAK